MLRKAIYPKIESTLNQAALWFNQKNISPNQLTLGGLALAFLAGWLYAGGHFFMGGIFLILSSLGDMLDGPLARATGRSSKFGAFLDSTVDRYADFFIFGGFAIYFASHDKPGWLFITLGIIMGAYITSYAKARAENLITECNTGVFERPERIIALAVASFIPFLRPLALLVLFIGTNATAIQRILYTQENLPKQDAGQTS